jgi:SAM-dependent methyltransferase
MNPQYSDAHLKEYYSHFTFEEPEWDEALLYAHHFYLSLVERYAQNKGSILDVGAGKGHLLVAAKQRGWQPIGYDVDEKSEIPISRKIGVDIVCGDFVKIPWHRDSFDVVYMHQVIEHLKSPVPYLDTIHSILKKGGVFFIAQPNIHSLAAIVKYGLEKIGLRKRYVGAYYGTEGHLWYYTPRTMAFALRKSGFQVLSMRSGHKARPHQSAFKRFLLRNIVEVIPWKSTFLVIARKE